MGGMESDGRSKLRMHLFSSFALTSPAACQDEGCMSEESSTSYWQTNLNLFHISLVIQRHFKVVGRQHYQQQST